MNKDDVLLPKSFPQDQGVKIVKSSLKDEEHNVFMIKREGKQEDPWISLVDHKDAIKQDMILYGGSSYGNKYASILMDHDGANVFIK